MTKTRPQPFPDPTDRATLNAGLHATGTDTGFWDDTGRPAPWPHDIDEWRPTSSDTITTEPEQPTL